MTDKKDVVITDADRLDWVIKHYATVMPGERMVTRRGGITEENMERVWQLEYVTETGDLVMQTPDSGHKTYREAIDAGMRGAR